MLVGEILALAELSMLWDLHLLSTLLVELEVVGDRVALGSR